MESLADMNKRYSGVMGWMRGKAEQISVILDGFQDVRHGYTTDPADEDDVPYLRHGEAICYWTYRLGGTVAVLLGLRRGGIQ